MFAYLHLMSILDPIRTRLFIIIAIIALILIIRKIRKGKKNKQEILIDEMKPSAKKDMLVGLRDNAPAFAELYEPLYFLSKGNGGRKEWVFNSFNRIVSELDGQDAFKVAFAKEFGAFANLTPIEKKDNKRTKKCVKSANKLLKLLGEAGIRRDVTSCVTADEVTAENYDTVGNASLVTGKKYDVLAAYWTLTVKTKMIAEEAEEEKAEEPVQEAKAEETEEAPVEEAPVEEATVEEAAAEDAVAEDAAEETKTEEAAVSKKDAKKAKKADKKAAKKNKKAAKKNKKAAKKAEENIVINTETIFLCKGAVR